MYRLYNYFFKQQTETEEQKKDNESLNTYKCIRQKLIETATTLKDIFNIRDFSAYSNDELFNLYEKYKKNSDDHHKIQLQITSLKLDFNISEDREKYIKPINENRISHITLLFHAVYNRPGGPDFMKEVDLKFAKNLPPITF
jgi:hypothetical protein